MKAHKNKLPGYPQSECEAMSVEREKKKKTESQC